MKVNRVNGKIIQVYCFLCEKWYDIDPFELFLDIAYEGSISCKEDHVIGCEWDVEWQEITGVEISNLE